MQQKPLYSYQQGQPLKVKVKSCSNRLKIIMSKGNRFKTLMSRGSRFKILMPKGSRSKICMSRVRNFKILMSKVNRLNNLLTYMLLINSLWEDSIKPTPDWILLMGRVTSNGGRIKIHMDRIHHHGGKILTNKDGLYNMGLLKGPTCLLIRNCYSWPHWSCQMFIDLRMIPFFICHTDLQFHPRFWAIDQSLREKRRRINKPTWCHITSSAPPIRMLMIPFISEFFNELSQGLQQSGTSNCLEVPTMTSTLSLCLSSLISSCRFTMKLAPICLRDLRKTLRPISPITSINRGVSVTWSSLKFMISCWQNGSPNHSSAKFLRT